MKKKYRKLVSIVSASLLAIPAIAFAGGGTMTGKIDLGFLYNDGLDGNTAKFQEYLDKNDDASASVEMNVYKPAYFFSVTGSSIGQDGQSYGISGGYYGLNKYSLYYNEIIHNISFGGFSPYTNIGSKSLTRVAGVGIPATNTWQPVDYSTKRKYYGYDIFTNIGSSYFLAAKVNRMTKSGLKPFGTGYHGAALEIPEPIDHETTTSNIQLGYKSETLLAAVNASFSNFENDNLYLTWDDVAVVPPLNNPVAAGTLGNVNPLEAENEMWKIGADLTWRQLPAMSTLAAHASHAQNDSYFNTAQVGLTVLPGGLNTPIFDGEITYDNFSVALTSSPMPKVDTKIFYDYQRKENDSTHITYTDGVITVSNAGWQLGYKKNNFGIEGSMRLPAQTKISAAYEYLNVDREQRHDLEETKDNIFRIAVKNSSLDFLTVKGKYQRLERDADYHDTSLTFLNSGTGAVNPDGQIETYLRRFDATDKSQDRFQIGVEIYPIDPIDIGVDYAYIRNDYDDTVLGRTEDKGHELYGDVTWRLPQNVTLNGFVGYEKTEEDASMREYYTTMSANPASGSLTAFINGQNRFAFNWTSNRDDDFYTWGISLNAPLMNNRLQLSLSYAYQESDGEIDNTRADGTAVQDFAKVDDYSKDNFEIKGVYKINDMLDCTLGLLYEDFDYEDALLDAYALTFGNTILSGAYANQDYDVTVGYVMLNIHFGN